MIYISYGLAVLAILAMVVNAVMAFNLRKALIGGEIRARWGLLANFILVFLFGYILSPLLLVFSVPVEAMGAVVFMIFLGGAFFITIVIRILRDTLSVMGLLQD